MLRTSALGGTEMGCPGAGHAQDEWMVELFGSSPELELDGTAALAVRSEAAEVWFVPEDEVASGQPGDVDDLVGIEWRLDSIGERDGDSVGMTVVPRGVDSRIRFSGDEVRIWPGCNEGGGPVRVEEEQIRFDETELSARACPDARGDVEDTVIRVLFTGEPVTWSISGEELRLVTRDGRHELVYHR
jgi:heat shock protein HslJ